MNAFSFFGLPGDAFSIEEFLNDMHQDVFTFGRPPVAIDILTTVKGIEFEESYKSAELVQVGDVLVRLIHISHLVKAKRAAGRHKDLDDLENLEK